MSKSLVSSPVIKRLPRYYRFLGELERQGIVRISSRELSEMMGLTASQIRQDLNCFGGFGQQGYGYNVKELHSVISRILGIDAGNKTILIGAGNLGKAIASHIDFNKRGFRLIGIFDSNPEKCGKIISNLKISNMNTIESFCRSNHPVCAVLCIPKDAAKEIAPKLIELGIKGFWNFSHYDFAVDSGKKIIVENVHLTDSLMTLAYGLNNTDEEEN
ncbi:redox-sensing transcriptional repressor Rex [Porcipelethomonas sp.]|uniref:redox-sensing transcriptional repressor Rex n=1 Tax=Porcipelethomonas sp. TaxID=2981675 RepID=UPI003EF46E9A